MNSDSQPKIIPDGSYLSKRGYVVKKDSISKEELQYLKKHLRATPLQDEKYATYNNEDSSYQIYTETKNKLYLPKMYGIKRYGDPKRYIPNYIGKDWESDNDLQFVGNLFPNQIEPVNSLLNACKTLGGGILKAGTGTGKCHKIDTPILMFDGKIKLVQDVAVGDLLMGDDSTPRRVLSLARGRDIMYDIIPVKGETYTVNQEHILCLRISSKPRVELRKRKLKGKNNDEKEDKRKREGQGYSWQVVWFENLKFRTRGFLDKTMANNFCKSIDQQSIVEIPVRDYLKLPKQIKHVLKGYKVAVNFAERPVDFDPYIIGLWLGDGTSLYSQITNQDSKILHYLKNTLPKFDCYLQHKSEYVYNINGSIPVKRNSNKFLNELKDKNLLGNKHIPDIYKYNSRDNRLRLLAGLIDSDGYLDNSTFDIIQKSEKIIDDIIFLARSLGFACYKSRQKKGCYYKGEYRENYYYRISISGNTSEIPTLCSRKQAKPRRQIKNVLNTGITVKRLGVDNYYGFEIDGNSRYLLGDFTVTHNTLMSVHIISKLRVKTIVVVNKIPLMRQWESELKRFIPGITVGFIQGQKNVSVEGADVVIAMLQSLARVEYPDSLFEDFSLAIIDEIHNTSSRVFSQVLGKLCCRYTIGLSATPKRSDGCEYVFKYHIGDIVHESDVKRSGLPPVLKYIKIDSSEYNEISVVNRFTGQKQIQFTSMLSELITMPKRNRLILELIKDLVTTDNRKVLVLSDRREHLKNLKTDLDKDLSVDFTYGLFLGQMKQKDLQLSRASQVIFATFSAFGEGVSEKDLDTLILITPKKFVGHLKNSVKNESGKLEQIVGRIFRKDHTDKNPLIVDLHDNFSVYKNQSAQRRTFYKQHFTNAKTIYNQINLDEYETNDIKISCIKQTKTTGQIQENEDVNQTEQLLKHCVIED